MELNLNDTVIELIVETLSDAGVRNVSRAELIQTLDERNTERDWTASFQQALITPNEFAGLLLQFALHKFLPTDALEVLTPTQFESQRKRVAASLVT